METMENNYSKQKVEV